MDLCDSHLLVVDDSASMRACICDLLRDLGFAHIDEAADGAAAFTLFQRTPYDVVITDWYMPRFDGIHLLRTIRGGSERSQTPVLMLTGAATTTRMTEALEAGATGFITKPSVAPSLCEKVLRLVAAIRPLG